jgi:hypothetical protein
VGGDRGDRRDGDRGHYRDQGEASGRGFDRWDSTRGRDTRDDQSFGRGVDRDYRDDGNRERGGLLTDLLEALL